MIDRTFFQNTKAWPLKDASDPMDGWVSEDVMKTSVGSAVNDQYGKLYYFVRNILTSFHKKVRHLDISFNLFHLDAKQLVHCLSKGKFARIEVSLSHPSQDMACH